MANKRHHLNRTQKEILTNGVSYFTVFENIDSAFGDLSKQRTNPNRPTVQEKKLFELRKAFMDRICNATCMRLSTKHLRRNRSIEWDKPPTIDLMGDDSRVVDSYSIPFGQREIPPDHLNWLKEEVKKRGLWEIFKYTDS